MSGDLGHDISHVGIDWCKYSDGSLAEMSEAFFFFFNGEMTWMHRKDPESNDA